MIAVADAGAHELDDLVERLEVGGCRVRRSAGSEQGVVAVQPLALFEPMGALERRELGVDVVDLLAKLGDLRGVVRLPFRIYFYVFGGTVCIRGGVSPQTEGCQAADSAAISDRARLSRVSLRGFLSRLMGGAKCSITAVST